MLSVDDTDDPREVPWHPRFAQTIIGHDTSATQFRHVFSAGKPHHAWLLTGAKGIGKASLAYQLAAEILGTQNKDQSSRWIAARAHPDLFVLERRLGDSKPKKLKTEIAVNDARKLQDFFSHTSSGNWRIGLIDAADDLNIESANALLKLVEEPPPKCILFLVCHLPGRLLRTLKSRCNRLALQNISTDQTFSILSRLALEPRATDEDIQLAARLSFGSPGRALAILKSDGAKGFQMVAGAQRLAASDIVAIANKVAGRGTILDNFNIFADLFLDWVADRAAVTGDVRFADAHIAISESIRVANAFNLDRRQTVIAAVSLVTDVLKAA